MNAISTTRPPAGFAGFSGTFRRPQVTGRRALLESNGQGTCQEPPAWAGEAVCHQIATDPRTSSIDDGGSIFISRPSRVSSRAKRSDPVDQIASAASQPRTDLVPRPVTPSLMERDQYATPAGPGCRPPPAPPPPAAAPRRRTPAGRSP